MRQTAAAAPAHMRAMASGLAEVRGVPVLALDLAGRRSRPGYICRTRTRTSRFQALRGPWPVLHGGGTRGSAAGGGFKARR